MIRLVSMLLVTLLTLAGPTIAVSGSDYVLVDGTEQAYTVYAGIPQDQFSRIEQKLAQAPKEIALVPWETFAGDPERYVKKRIVVNDYPGSRAAEGVVELVRKYPGTPIGLAWNGGIAITYNDYQHAKRIYAEYKSDPAAYDERKENDPRRDPIRPGAHLGPLLGWQ